MFHDLDETLRAILDDPAAPDELRDADVSFLTPEKSFAPAEPTVNLFLFEVRENYDLRDPVPVVERTAGGYVQVPPPLRVACSYLVTAWSDESGPAKVVEEHRLLGQAMRWLSRFSTIQPEHYRGGLVEQPLPPPLTLAQPDGYKKINDFWSALGRPPQPAFCLTATISMISSEPEPLGPPVITRELRISPDAAAASPSEGARARSLSLSAAPAARRSSATAETFEEFNSIGGRVTDADGAPLVGATVLLSKLRAVATTDESGRYSFARVPPGRHRLRVRAGTLRQTVSFLVPAPAGTTYDVKLTPETPE
jgi:hypothetical protein